MPTKAVKEGKVRRPQKRRIDRTSASRRTETSGPTSVYFSTDELEALTRQAIASGRAVSQEARWIIRQTLGLGDFGSVVNA